MVLSLVIMHDYASANKIAMHTLQVLYPAVLGIGCFSNTLNCVGEGLMPLMLLTLQLIG